MTESSHHRLSRRGFVRAATVGGVLSASGAIPCSGAMQVQDSTDSPSLELSDESVILFQGDSITDSGRNRNAQSPNHHGALGHGYASIAATGLLGAHPGSRLQCYNRGVSGNKVPNLAERWEADCLELQPTLLSILIGVNDLWHKLNGGYDGTVEQYEEGFAELLTRTREALPEVVLVICEPFVLRCGAVNDNWFPEFDERLAAARRVAEGAEAIWVPFQEMFNEAVTEETPANYWAGDGVHPSLAGHALMARTWLDVTGLG